MYYHPLESVSYLKLVLEVLYVLLVFHDERLALPINENHQVRLMPPINLLPPACDPPPYAADAKARGTLNTAPVAGVARRNRPHHWQLVVLVVGNRRVVFDIDVAAQRAINVNGPIHVLHLTQIHHSCKR